MLTTPGDIHPFLLSAQQIDRQTFYWMLWLYCFFAIYNAIILSFVSKEVRKYFWAVVILAGLEIIEFYINYNHEWFGEGSLLNITSIRWIVLFYIGSKTLRKIWKQNQLRL